PRRSGSRSSRSIPAPGEPWRTASWRRRSVVGRRSGLGRGLGALIPTADSGSAEDSVLRELPIALVKPNRYQPRDHFDDDALASLAASVRELGVLQPVLVRPVDDHFELIAGERRWR